MGANGSSVRLVMAMTVEGVAVGEMAEGGWSGGLPRGLVAVGGGCVGNIVGTGTGGGGSLMVGRGGGWKRWMSRTRLILACCKMYWLRLAAEAAGVQVVVF
jgi:hypothetical protein